jgi:hypothetical protein
MEENTKQIDRQSLYEAVWADPVTIVADRYGLSDVGLAKICRRLSIPLPSRGYWAKIKAGKIMARAPLPKLDPPQSRVLTLNELNPMQMEARSTTKQKEREIRESASSVVVPVSLDAPHPLVKIAAQRLKQRDGWSDEKGLRAAPDEVLNINVTRLALDRTLLLVDTLLKELANHSISAAIDSKAKATVLNVEGTPVTFTITETVKRTDHQETPAETKARKKYHERSRWDISMDYPHVPRFDFHATGMLTITAGHWPSRNWRDTEKTSLEKRLGEIVSGIISLAAEIKEKNAEAARQAEKRRLAEERYTFLKNRLETERAGFKNLETDAEKWEQAKRLRDYVNAVEHNALTDGALSSDVISWITWARAKADWLDPLIQVSDPILDAPEPKKPGYW